MQQGLLQFKHVPCKKFSSFLFLALLKEWTTLTDYLGGLTVAGTVIKKDDAKWTSNTGTNTSVFSGLPSGYRVPGSFSDI